MPTTVPLEILEEMNDRSREVFRRVVEGYLETGDPVERRNMKQWMLKNKAQIFILMRRVRL